MTTLRTPKTQKAYEAYKAKCLDKTLCWMCEKPSLQVFPHWRIVENSFPYDRIASVHNMLIPKRHVHESDLTIEELSELAIIKNTTVSEDYEYILWATLTFQSVPSHYHVHLMVSKYCDRLNKK